MTGKQPCLKSPASTNRKPMSKMPHMVARLAISDLNQHLTCALCSGYMIDATTVVECLHSFCRSCLLRYLETSNTCPICDTQINTAQLDKCVRADHTLQDLVYKLVPGLYKSELRRRKDFYLEQCKSISDDASTSKSERLENSSMQIFDKHLVELSAFICTPDEIISFSLETTKERAQHIEEKEKSTAMDKDANGSVEHKPQQKCLKDEISKKEDLYFKRYFRCPAAVTVGHLKKLLAYKMDLSSSHQVEILHSDEPLLDEYTLMDIAYIYTWRRKAPLQLFFNICKYEAEDEPMPLLMPEVNESLSSPNSTTNRSPRIVTEGMTALPEDVNAPSTSRQPDMANSVYNGIRSNTHSSDTKNDGITSVEVSVTSSSNSDTGKLVSISSLLGNAIGNSSTKSFSHVYGSFTPPKTSSEASMRGKPPLPIYRTDPGPLAHRQPVVQQNRPTNGFSQPLTTSLVNGKMQPLRIALTSEKKKSKKDGTMTPKVKKPSLPKPPKFLHSPPDFLAALRKIAGFVPVATNPVSIPKSSTVPLSSHIVGTNGTNTLIDTVHSATTSPQQEPSPPGAYTPTAAQSACTQPAKLRLKKSLSSVVQELSSNALEACSPSKKVKLENGEEETHCEPPLIH